MKTIICGVTAVVALVSSSLAGGIQGRVVDSNGYPRSNVRISVKEFRQSTTTDCNGSYVLKLPDSADGSRVNVLVNGKFAVNCLVPVGQANSTVKVTLIRR